MGSKGVASRVAQGRYGRVAGTPIRPQKPNCSDICDNLCLSMSIQRLIRRGRERGGEKYCYCQMDFPIDHITLFPCSSNCAYLRNNLVKIKTESERPFPLFLLLFHLSTPPFYSFSTVLCCLLNNVNYLQHNGNHAALPLPLLLLLLLLLLLPGSGPAHELLPLPRCKCQLTARG